MKRFQIVVFGLLTFSAGFLAGQYRYSSLETLFDTSDNKNGGKILQDGAQGDKYINKSATLNKSSQSFKSTSLAPLGRLQGVHTTGLPIPNGIILTNEAQADLLAQQLEAKEANIKYLEEMIRSLEENKATEDEIIPFREMKKAMEEQPIEELQASEPIQPERTEDEFKEDYAAALEEAGIPLEEREKILDEFDTQFNPPIENTGIEPATPTPMK